MGVKIVHGPDLVVVIRCLDVDGIRVPGSARVKYRSAHSCLAPAASAAVGLGDLGDNRLRPGWYSHSRYRR